MVVSTRIQSGDKPWPQVPVGNKDHTNATVVIIGAGISGICTAIDLIRRTNLHNFVILEKSSGIGGTWHDNKYPGCCCDVWSALYSYSFEQNPDWTRMYPGQEEILDYLTEVCEKYKLYRHIRFNTTVDKAYWDEQELKWKTVVAVSGTKDSEYTKGYEITSDFLVSAVGQLNSPQYPEIPGLDEYTGKKMHSARWDWSYKLDGKRIAVIGNGATAAQIIPEIAKVASHVTVYQRTPNWVIPRQDAPVSPAFRTLLRYAPPYRWRFRAQMMDYRESFYDAVTDGDSDFAQMLRDFCTDMMHTQLPNQPEMWEKLTPTYNPGCKRVIISDDYYPALARDNVSLETAKIGRITETGIEVERGASEDFDLLVLATGFRTVEFMHPISITGVGGRGLEEIWKSGAEAYNGVVVEDLPNFGMLYGPNTNLGHNSIILMIEAQSRYITALVGAVLDARKQGKQLALTPKHEVVEAYNKRVQEVLNKSSFADPKCNSWYKNKDGKITNNWSGTVVEYQKLLSELDWADFEAEGNGREIVEKKGTSKLGRVQEETSFSNMQLAISALGIVAVGAGFVARTMMKNGRGIRVW